MHSFAHSFIHFLLILTSPSPAPFKYLLGAGSSIWSLLTKILLTLYPLKAVWSFLHTKEEHTQITNSPAWAFIQVVLMGSLEHCNLISRNSSVTPEITITGSANQRGNTRAQFQANPGAETGDNEAAGLSCVCRPFLVASNTEQRPTHSDSSPKRPTQTRA